MSRGIVKFWGVRGSVPSPLTNNQLAQKALNMLKQYELAQRETDMNPERFIRDWKLNAPLTYGGNTSCVEVRYANELYILDMGTGLREFGNSLIPLMFDTGGLSATFLLSHLHWDHIQGIPFFGPLYVNKHIGIENSWRFFGGTGWQETAEVCLRGQMNAPKFPVDWHEIGKITHSMEFRDVYDLMSHAFPDGTKVVFGKLNHPQETYGMRFTFPNGKVIAYTTDQEPYDPLKPDPRLLRLAQGADIWITDCQYTQHIYNYGTPPRHGWGHSYDVAVAETAIQAGVKTVVLFHHDPGSSDEKVLEIQLNVKTSIGTRHQCAVIAAYEGLELDF